MVILPLALQIHSLSSTVCCCHELKACPWPPLLGIYETSAVNVLLWQSLIFCHFVVLDEWVPSHASGSAGELHDQLQRRGKLPLEDARFYAAEIVLILEYLQGQKVSPHGF